MKILYVCLDPRQPFYAPTGGGARMREMVRALREEGQEVEVYAHRADPAYAEKPDEAGAVPPHQPGSLKKFVKFFIPDKGWNLLRDLNDVRLDRKKEPALEALIKKFAPDAIYEMNAYLYAACARVADRTGTPYFVEYNAPTAEERIEMFGAPLAAWHRRVEAFQYRTARGIMVVSEPLKQYVMKGGVETKKIAIVPNGVRLQRFDGCKEKGIETKKKLGLDGPVIGFVGSFASFHRLDLLFEAMVEVRNKIPEAVALIVGGGPYLDDMRRLAEKAGLGEGIKFVGEVNADDVPAYVGAFDVAVLPGTAEYCNPIKLFEYGLAGVPIVAATTQPVKEILGGKNNGVFADGSAAISKAIIGLLSDNKRARAMSKSFRKRVLENFTWRHAAKKAIRFMEERRK